MIPPIGDAIAHAAEADPRHLQTLATKLYIFHCSIAWGERDRPIPTNRTVEILFRPGDDHLRMADAGEVEGREAVAQGRIPLRLLAPKSLTLRPAPKPVSQSPEPFDPHSSHHRCRPWS